MNTEPREFSRVQPRRFQTNSDRVGQRDTRIRDESVAQRSTKRIPLDDVALFGDGDREIIVYHWRLVPGESQTGYVADSLRTITLEVD